MPSRSKAAQRERSECHSFECQHLVPDTCHQSADFTILAFLQFQFQNRTPALAAVNSHAAELEEALSKIHPVAELVQDVRFRNAGDMAAIAADHLESRMCEPLSQIAVVCDQQHPFGIFVKTSHGEQSLICHRYQIHSSRTSLRIVVRAKHSLGLVDKEVPEPRQLETFAVEANILRLRTDRPRWIGHDFAFDRDTSSANVLLTIAPRIDARHREKLL